MLFNSIIFLIFFAIVFIIYYLVKPKYRNFVLLVSSYIFYLYSDIKNVFVLVFITFISYFAGILVERTSTNKKRKLVVFFSIFISIGTLIYFKYLSFFINSINLIFSARLLSFKTIVPLGISFFILQSVTYPIDVYRKDVEVEKNILRYAAFVSFFPCILSGPINKSKELLPQFKKEHRFSSARVYEGLIICLYGFFQKIVIADCLAIGVNNVYSNLESFKGFPLLIVVFLYSLQIYLDFSSYSKIAYGISKILGFDVINNFKLPYFSSSIKEFWGRWHISLSTWFKEYLYFPLGGNRKGKIRTYVNIMIVFIISGLWHGASFTFIIWGFLHACYQILERIFKFSFKCKFLNIIFTFILVTFAWVFFRADSFKDACYIITNVFNFNFHGIKSQILSIGFDRYDIIVFSSAILLNFIIELFSVKFDLINKLKKMPLIVRCSIYLFFIFSIIIFGTYGPGFDKNQFIYLGY